MKLFIHKQEGYDFTLKYSHCYMHALCKLPSPFIIKYLKKWGENNSKMKALNKLEMVAMF